MKWIKCLILILALAGTIFAGATLSFAEPEIVECPDIKLIINGQMIKFNDTVIALNGSTLLPLRELLENLGVKNDDEHIIWNNYYKTVTVKKEGKTIFLKQGSTTAYVDGAPVNMEIAPIGNPENGRTYIPVRFVAQTLGWEVYWDQATKSIFIYDGDSYNDIKEYIEKAEALLSDSDKYKILVEIETEIKEDNGIKGIENMSGIFKVDNKNKVVHSTAKSDFGTYQFYYEMYLYNNAVFYRYSDNEEWTVRYLGYTQYNIEFINSVNVMNIIPTGEPIYTGLKMDVQEKDVILEGDVVLIDDSFEYSQVIGGNTKIVIDKKEDVFKKVTFNQTSTVPKTSETCQMQGLIKYEYNKDVFDIIIPENFEQLLVKAQVEELVQQGLTLSYCGEYEDAVKKFDMAIELDGQCANAYYEKAAVYSIVGEIENAVSSLKKSISLNSSFKDRVKFDTRFNSIKEAYDID